MRQVDWESRQGKHQHLQINQSLLPGVQSSHSLKELRWYIGNMIRRRVGFTDADFVRLLEVASDTLHEVRSVGFG